jgi:dolichol kinase
VEHLLLVGFPLLYVVQYTGIPLTSLPVAAFAVALVMTVLHALAPLPSVLRLTNTPASPGLTVLVATVVVVGAAVYPWLLLVASVTLCAVALAFCAASVPEMTAATSLVAASLTVPSSWGTMAFFIAVSLGAGLERLRWTRKRQRTRKRRATVPGPTPTLATILLLLSLATGAALVRQLVDWYTGAALPYPASSTVSDSLWLQVMAVADAGVVTVVGVAVVSTLPAARVSTRRKYFHLVALLTLARLHVAYPTAIVADTTLIGLAGALLLEAGRLWWPASAVARTATSYMTSFTDDKGELATAPIVSHTMLLAGLCVPLWLSQPGACVPDAGWWLGIASTGVGDAAASLVPSLLRTTHPWPLNRRKSIEGAVACSLAFIGVALTLTGAPHVRLALVVGATEATVASTDNLLLPLAAAAAQLASCALYRAH